MKLKLLAIPILISTLHTNAEVTLDGTLGRRGALPGPDYQIGADLGQQRGGNLFHSFQDFNLNRAESATFSGPNSVNNVISRVTGGNPSQIDGLIRSTIPNADMYFLNPNGIMFGKNARLDVQGGFHASTADYLRLRDGGRFDARYPSDSLLTVAPIEAFGFLTDTPASITTQDSSLSVFEGKTLSLIGGNLELNGNSPVMFDEKGFMAVFARSKLSALAGRINLASVASQGEVIPSEFGLDLNAEGGTITANNTLMDVSGRGSGNIFIRGGQFFMDTTTIQANTLADQNGKGIDMKVTDSIDIKGDMIAILSNTMGSGNAGNITLTAPYLTVTGSVIETNTFGTGNAGNIIIEAKQISLDKGSIINSDTFANGQAGNININATEFVSISGQRKGILVVSGIDRQDNVSQLTNDTYGGKKSGSITITTRLLNLIGGLIATNNYGIYKSSDITVNADKIKITGGGLITSLAFLYGDGGKININTNTMSIIGKRSGLLIFSVGAVENNQSSIATISFGKGAAGNISVVANDLTIDDRGGISAGTASKGAAGDITVTVNNLFLGAGAEINSSSGGLIGDQILIGQGPGANVHVIATNHITISGQDNRGLPSAISTNSLGIGKGGNVKVETNHLNIKDGGAITAKAMETGNAGNVVVQANTIKITNSGTITTTAENATGGNITIVVPNLLFLREGQITTSVHGGTGDGGNITIENPVFVVMNNGKIIAQADEGQGGDIYIKSGHFVTSPNSLVSASSKLGLDGEVEIDSPDMDMEGFIVILPGGFVDASRLMKIPCNQRLTENLSRFVVIPSEGAHNSPGDLLLGGPLLSDSLPIKMTTKKSPKKSGSPPSPFDLKPSCLSNANKTDRQSSVIPEEQLF
jgi:filamentous hemagglutinin family protein